MIRGTRVLYKAAAVVAESPRITIAKNILSYQAMHNATSDAALTEASKPIASLDVNNLPASIAELKDYLSTSSANAGTGFKPNPEAWQNKDFGPMVAEEAGYTWFWPFLFGGAVSGFLFGVLPALMLSQEGRKKSNYIKMLEGKHGHGHEEAAAAPAGAEHHHH